MNLKELPAQTRRTARLFYQAQAAGMMFEIIMVQGGLIALYLLFFGGSEKDIALAFSVFSGFSFLQVFTAAVIEKGNKKCIILYSFIFGTIAISLLPLAGLVFQKGGYPAGFILFILIALIFRIINNFAGAAWFPFISELIPEEVIGQFFGKLRVIWQSIAFVVILIMGTLLGSSPRLWQFNILFIFLILLQLLRILFITKLPDDPPRSIVTEKSFLSIIRHPLQNAGFRKFLLFAFLLLGSHSAFIPFVVPFLNKKLGLAASSVAYVNSALAVGSFVLLLIWGKLSDAFGTRLVFFSSLVISSLGYLLFFFESVASLSEPVQFMISLAGNFFFGIGASGSGIGLTARLIQETPPGKKGGYMSLYLSITGLAGVIVPLVIGTLLDVFAGSEIAVFSSSGSVYSILFLLLMFWACCLLMILKWLKPKRDRKIRDIFKEMLTLRFNRYFH